mmetsp:Transcript_45164/g.130404  ORF Transcript_45164/g.130404 Transcript_45164/m.130404 type:complete len:215 (+) Transcript_45164:734-1378(+)
MAMTQFTCRNLAPCGSSPQGLKSRTYPHCACFGSRMRLLGVPGSGQAIQLSRGFSPPIRMVSRSQKSSHTVSAACSSTLTSVGRSCRPGWGHAIPQGVAISRCRPCSAPMVIRGGERWRLAHIWQKPLGGGSCCRRSVARMEADRCAPSSFSHTEGCSRDSIATWMAALLSRVSGAMQSHTWRRCKPERRRRRRQDCPPSSCRRSLGPQMFKHL